MSDLTPALITFVFAFGCGLAILLCLALLARNVRARGGRLGEALVGDGATVAQSGVGGLVWTIRGLGVIKAAAMLTFAFLLAEAVR